MSPTFCSECGAKLGAGEHVCKPSAETSHAMPLRSGEVFTSEAEKFRQYLQQLLDLTKNSLIGVGLVVVAGLGLFGFKTIFDVDDRITRRVNEAIEQQIKDKMVHDGIERELKYYADASLLQYLGQRLRNDPDGEDTKIDDVSVERLLAIAGDPSSALFKDAMSVLAHPHDDLGRHSDRIGPLILGALEKSWASPSRILAPEAESTAILALGAIGYEPAGPLLTKVASSNTAHRQARVAAAKAARELLTEREQEQVAMDLAKAAHAAIASDAATARALMMVALAMDNSTALGDVGMALASSKKPAEVVLLTAVLASESAYRDLGDFISDIDAERDMPDIASTKIGRLAGALMNNEIFRFESMRRGSGYLPTSYMLAEIGSSDDESRSVALREDGLPLRLFAHAAAKSVPTDPARKISFCERIIRPLLLHEKQRLSVAKTRGFLGANPEFDWQGGYVLSYPSRPDGKPHLMVGYDKETRSITLLGPVGLLSAPKTFSVPIDQVRLSPMRYKDARDPKPPGPYPVLTP